jgi:hypothetical protein
MKTKGHTRQKVKAVSGMLPTLLSREALGFLGGEK